MVRMPSPLKADRLSQAFCGTVSVTVYPASDVFAFANGWADAGPAVTQNAMNVIAYARMNSPVAPSELRIRTALGGSRVHRGYFTQSSQRARVPVRRWVAGLRAGTWIERRSES